eukprot:jgi/Bigna1/129567/aug1.9_g4275
MSSSGKSRPNRSSYYDIDDILIESEPVTVSFRIDATDLGYLDPNGISDDVKEDAKVQVPFWLAESLKKRNVVDINIPDYLGKAFEKNFLAEPEAMDLRERCPPHFYELGQRLSELFQDPSITGMLLKGLGARFREIIVRSTVWRANTHAPFVSKLALLEEEILNTKHDAERAIYKWRTGDKRYRKRKKYS